MILYWGFVSRPLFCHMQWEMRSVKQANYFNLTVLVYIWIVFSIISEKGPIGEKIVLC